MTTNVGELWVGVGGGDKDLVKVLKGAEQKVERSAKTMSDAAQVKVDADTKQAEKAVDAGGKRIVKQAKEIGDDAGKKMGDGISSHVGAAVAALGLGAIAEQFLGKLDEADQRKRQSGIMDSQAGVAGTPFAGGLMPAAQDIYYAGNAGSMEEAQAAVTNLAGMIGGLGDVSEETFKQQAAQALAVANTLGVDVNQAVLAASELISNDLASNATEAFDLIQAGSNAGANRFGDMADTIIEYAKDWRQLGVSAEQGLAMAATGQQKGARNADVLADAYKEFYIKVGGGAPDAAKALDDLGITAADAAKVGITGLNRWAVGSAELTKMIAEGGPKAQQAYELIRMKVEALGTGVTQNQVGVGLWGTKWEDAGAQAVLAMKPVEAQLNNVDGAAQRATDAQKLEGWRLSFEQNVTKPASEWFDGLAKAQSEGGGKGMIEYVFGKENVADFQRGMDDVIAGWNKLKADALDPVFGVLQTIWDKMNGFADNQFVQWILGVNSDGSNTGGQGGVAGAILANSPAFQAFNLFAKSGDGNDFGGTVPGPIGSPQLRVLHGGEQVIPAHRNGHGGGGGGLTINGGVHVNGGPTNAGTQHAIERGLIKVAKERR